MVSMVEGLHSLSAFQFIISLFTGMLHLLLNTFRAHFYLTAGVVISYYAAVADAHRLSSL